MGTLQKNPNREKVFFLPDPTLSYNNQQVDNRRHSLIQHQAVQDFIDVSEEKFTILNMGERKNQHGRIKLSDTEADLLRQLDTQGAQIMMYIMQLNPERNHLCRCGSGKKYKKCHRV